MGVLRGIEPVYYRYNGKANIQEKNYFVGVVAQDLEKVAPYMVGSFESADGTLPADQQEANTKTYKSVDNGAMTYIAINAIKELDQRQEKMREVVKNVTDFGIAQGAGQEVFVPFDAAFTQLLDNTPIVTVTPLGSNVRLQIVKQTKTGFTLRAEGDTGEYSFNWIAMAKVKDSVLKVDQNYSTAERNTMLAKVKAEEATINYEAERAEAEKRKAEQAAEAQAVKAQESKVKAKEESGLLKPEGQETPFKNNNPPAR